MFYKITAQLNCYRDFKVSLFGDYRYVSGFVSYASLHEEALVRSQPRQRPMFLVADEVRCLNWASFKYHLKQTKELGLSESESNFRCMRPRKQCLDITEKFSAFDSGIR